MTRLISALIVSLALLLSVPAHQPILHAQSVGGQPAAWQDLQWGLAAANVPPAWQYATGKGTTLCSVDSGVDVTHSDIAPAYVGGYNAVEPLTPADIRDSNTHGTHTVGIALARGHEIQGVAPAANLLVAKVLGADGSGSDGSVTAGMAFCIEHGATVVNMSLGGDTDGYDAMQPLIAYGCAHGVDFSVASGNHDSGGTSSDMTLVPAIIHSSCLIAVESIDPNGHLSSFSNLQENPRSVAAPGSGILSTWPGGGVGMDSGTSMAAPYVSGTLLLLRSQGLSAKAAVRCLLTHAAVPAGDSFNRSLYVHGVLDTGSAVYAAHMGWCS